MKMNNVDDSIPTMMTYNLSLIQIEQVLLSSKRIKISNFKYIVIFLCALFLKNTCVSKDLEQSRKPFLSSEIYFIYPYPPIYFTRFNYGIGGEISQDFKPFKVSTGFFFYTNNSYHKYDQTSPFDKEVVSLNYLNFPVLIKIKLNKQNKTGNTILLNTGIVINIPKNYNSTLYYKNNNSPQKEIAIKYHNGSALRLGLQYSKSLNNRLNLYTNVFWDYKFRKDYIEFAVSNPHPGSSSSYKGNILFWGLSFGIEFMFSKKQEM